jgi:hypothetical protein
MRKGLVISLCCVFGNFYLSANAQEPLPNDSTILNNSQQKVRQVDIKSDTISPLIQEKPIVLTDSIITIGEPEFKPDSKKAVIYSAIFPGAGQIYNRKYWKLPIIYGGALGLTYAITWNGARYSEYSQAYKDLVLGTGTSYLDFGVSQSDVNSNKQRYIDLFKKKKDFFRRNRDLAIIISVGVYALCMLDAYVDAQLYDFDMSPDLSMRIQPMIWMPTSYSKASFGVQWIINF